jgi:SAM-dependent methyltransferase
VGGGAGYFTAAFRAAGADCYLFEPDLDELLSSGPVSDGTVKDGVVLADGYWLPVRDGCADICFSSNVLEHVADPIGLIGEMIRVTRPGGLIYLSFTNWYSPWGGHEMSPWHYLGCGSPSGATSPGTATPPSTTSAATCTASTSGRRSGWPGPCTERSSSTQCRATTRAGAGSSSGSRCSGRCSPGTSCSCCAGQHE